MHVAAVVVFYRPRIDAVDIVRDLAASGVKFVVVVNEASEEVLRHVSSLDNVFIIDNGRNVGLATALNQGIDTALADQSVNAVLLLDQDSKPTLDMVASLYDSLQDLTRNGRNPGCVGPRLVDVKSPTAKVAASDQSHKFVPVDSLATSGTLIPREALKQVGPMMDQLFIDCIDHEWCLRAKSIGLTVFMINDAVMLHDMGDGAIKFFGRFKPLHRSPIRHYYIIRNHLFMMRLKHIPLTWKLKELFKTARRIVAYVLISSNKKETSRVMFSAVLDGFKSELNTHIFPEKRG